MRHTWLALTLGSLLLANADAVAQPLGPGSPGVPPVGQTEPGAPGVPVPPVPPEVPETPDVPINAPAPPSFGDPPQGNAFDGTYPSGSAGPGFIFNVGAIALRREVLDSKTMATLDPGIVFPPFPTFFDYGPGANLNGPAAANLSGMSGNYGAGIKASLVFPGEASLFEITGYYIPRVVSQSTTSNESRLNLAFSTSPPPLGFEGHNGLWLQADQVKLTLENEIGNVEMNMHFGSNTAFDLLLGVRYFCLKDSFTIFTDDDGLILAAPDPTKQAIYTIISESQLVGPQLGLQWRIMLDDPDVFVGLGASVLPGVNFNQVDVSLKRGDGFAGPSGHRVQTLFSQMMEFNLSFEFSLTDRMWFRAGYHAMLLLNMPVSYDQVNFDPGNTNGTNSNNGMALFHGPSIMVQF